VKLYHDAGPPSPFRTTAFTAIYRFLVATAAATTATATASTTAAAATVTTTTAATSASAATTTAATAAAIFARSCFVHGERTTIMLGLIQTSNCCLSFRIALHLDEAEALAAARFTIGNYLSAFHGTVLREKLFQV
jgi:hypothetical protein